MPYIDPKRREPLEPNAVPNSPGELNFVITRLITAYVYRKGMTYENLSAARAAAQDASDEFYRRVVVPYEDVKKSEHGDVYAGLVHITGEPVSAPAPPHEHYWRSTTADPYNKRCDCGAACRYDMAAGEWVEARRKQA